MIFDECHLLQALSIRAFKHTYHKGTAWILRLHLGNTSGRRYFRHPDPRWNQGRGIYGGLTFATIVGAVESMTELPIRHLSAELCAPISPKPCMIRLSLKRKGRHTAFFAGELLQEETTVALTHVTCGADRASDLDQHPPVSFPRHQVPRYRRRASCLTFPNSSNTGPTTVFLCPRRYTPNGGWIAPRFESSSTAALIVAPDAWWPATTAETPTHEDHVIWWTCSIPDRHRGPIAN